MNFFSNDKTIISFLPIYKIYNIEGQFKILRSHKLHKISIAIETSSKMINTIKAFLSLSIKT